MRYLVSFFITSIFYVAIFVATYLLFSNENKPKKLHTELTKIHLKLFKDEVKSKPKPKLQPTLKKPKPKKTLKKIVKKLKPKKIVQKPKKVKKPKTHIVKAIKKITKTVKIIKPKVKVKPVLNEEKYNLEKQIYFKRLKERIDENKIYPRKALRRNIQGSVKVSFTLSKNGEFLGIKKLDGKKIFYKAVKKAIKNALPFKPKKDILTQSVDIELKLVFNIS